MVPAKFCPGCGQPLSFEQIRESLYLGDRDDGGVAIRNPIWAGICSQCGWVGQVESEEQSREELLASEAKRRDDETRT